MVRARDVLTIAALVMNMFAQLSAIGATLNRSAFEQCVDEALSGHVPDSQKCLALDAACRNDLQEEPEWRQHFVCDAGVKTCLDIAKQTADLNLQECLPPGMQPEFPG